MSISVRMDSLTPWLLILLVTFTVNAQTDNSEENAGEPLHQENLCEYLEQSCPTNMLNGEVCATNAITFENECELWRANCKRKGNQYLAVYTNGPCPEFYCPNHCRGEGISVLCGQFINEQGNKRFKKYRNFCKFREGKCKFRNIYGIDMTEAYFVDGKCTDIPPPAPQIVDVGGKTEENEKEPKKVEPTEEPKGPQGQADPSEAPEAPDGEGPQPPEATEAPESPDATNAPDVPDADSKESDSSEEEAAPTDSPQPAPKVEPTEPPKIEPTETPKIDVTDEQKKQDPTEPPKPEPTEELKEQETLPTLVPAPILDGGKPVEQAAGSSSSGEEEKEAEAQASEIPESEVPEPTEAPEPTEVPEPQVGEPSDATESEGTVSEVEVSEGDESEAGASDNEESEVEESEIEATEIEGSEVEVSDVEESEIEESEVNESELELSSAAVSEEPEQPVEPQIPPETTLAPGGDPTTALPLGPEVTTPELAQETTVDLLGTTASSAPEPSSGAKPGVKPGVSDTGDACVGNCDKTIALVCGTDGLTYLSECLLTFTGCLLRDPSLKVAQQGPCPP